MLTLQCLPAREGDAIWIRWGEDPNALKNMFVDMGTEAIGRDIRERLEELPESQRAIELLVVSHVDRDHIGGVLTCLAEAEPLPGLEIADIWFNGFQHLNGDSRLVADGDQTDTPGLESQGAVQGERLTKWLRNQNWNKAFHGGAVQRLESGFVTIVMDEDLKITVLGPTRERLEDFIETWEEDVAEALRKGKLDEADVSPGLETMGSSSPPRLDTQLDLEKLAARNISSDSSEANGSSIALLLEYKEKRLLLSGDAFSQDLVEACELLEQEPLKLDLFKLPHHSSKKNVHKELVEAVDCQQWLISTDGNRFKHPDAEAIARILCFDRNTASHLAFNVRSTFNGWWDNADWQQRYGYTTVYGDEADGLILSFD